MPAPHSVRKSDRMEGSDDGAHSYTDAYGFSGGYYERIERQFYGFSQVETYKADGSVLTRQYENDSYYTKGLLKFSTVEDESGRLYQSPERIYDTEKVFPAYYNDGKEGKFIALREERSTTYDPLTGDSFTTSTRHS
jgi:hypothetical protein